MHRLLIIYFVLILFYFVNPTATADCEYNYSLINVITDYLIQVVQIDVVRTLIYADM